MLSYILVNHALQIRVPKFDNVCEIRRNEIVLLKKITTLFTSVVKHVSSVCEYDNTIINDEHTVVLDIYGQLMH